VHYQHDAAGRLIRRQLRTPSGKRLNWQYRWDALDQLVEVATPDGHRWRYLYDGVGRRVAKHRAGSRTPHDTVLFSWDGARLAEQVCPGTGEATSWDYEPGSFRPVTQRRRRQPVLPAGHPSGAGPAGGFDERAWSDAEIASVVTDLLGTPTDLLAVDGARVTWTAQPASTIWGAVDDPTGAPRPCPLGYPGQYHDDESGLVYNLHRYYDPLTASYLSVDPLGLAGGLHPHRYVDHPLATADPLGLAPYTPPTRSTPLGFSGAEDFTRFGERLHAGLSEAGFPGTAALFQGSSVTGVSYRLGVPFDVGRVSDFDVALAGRPLLGRAVEVGTALRSRGARTAPLDATALGRLGLHQLSQDLSNLAGRSVNFMIYESVNAALERGPSILVP
jgi:RHS repeat-associated protein